MRSKPADRRTSHHGPSPCGQPIPPPYDIRATLLSLPLAADKGALQAICDERLNLAPAEEQLRYEVLSSWVNLQVIDYHYMSSSLTTWRELGWIRQRELLCAISIVREIDGRWEWGVFVPHIFVDHPFSMLAGREVVGFPKLIGDFSLSRPFGRYPISMDTLVFLGDSQEAASRTLIEIESVDGDVPPPLEPKEFSFPFGPLRELVRDDELPEALLEQIARAWPLKRWFDAQAKVFRDVEYAEHSCYRAMTRGVFAIDNDPMIVPMPPALVRFHSYPQLDVAAELALRRNGQGEAISVRPYRFEATMTFSDARTLWSLES